MSVFNHDGSSRWSIKLPVGDEGQEVAPLADHDVIFSGHAGAVSAVRVADGSVEWSQPLGTSVYNLWLISGLLVVNVDQALDHPKVVGLDPGSGAKRWTYDVPGGGFVGDAALTGDGGLAFRTGAGTLMVLDASNGIVRWSRHAANGPNDDSLPSAASGVVFYVNTAEQMYALDARTGALRWQVPAGQSGRVLVSGNVGVVVPDVVSGPAITVVAHSLDSGVQVWRRDLADISAVFPDQAGFLLMDYRADTLTLAGETTAAPVWQARLRKIDNLDQSPVTIQPSGELSVLQTDAVAFVDRNTGKVRQVRVPLSGASNSAAGADGLFVTSGTELRLVTAGGVSWAKRLPHFVQTAPAALDDGGVAAQTEDLVCVSGI